MLNTMRQNLKSLTWILWLAVASFVIAIFVDWGRAGDAARAGGNANWMARVNGEPITIGEFRNTYNQLDRFYRQIYREQYDPSAMGVARQALGELVRNRLVIDEAHRLGLRVSDQEVNDRIHSTPAFQEDGRFVGVERYRQVVRSMGYEPNAWEENVRTALLTEKFRRLVTDGISVSVDEVRDDYRRRQERVTADYVLLRTADFASDEPLAEEDLRAYHMSHSARYNSPELRRASYVLVDPDRIPGVATVTDEEARRYYEENRDRIYSTPEQVRASHILFRLAEDAAPDQEEEVRARAEEILSRVRAGEDFAQLAQEFSEDESNSSQGGDLGLFGRERMVAPFSEAAFSLPVGGTSDLVRTQFGFHIIRVTDRREATSRPYTEVRDAILRQLQFTRSREALRETVATFRGDVDGDPASFGQAAERLGLEVRQTDWLAADGAVPEIGDYPQVAQALFRTEVGSVSTPVALPQGTLFLRNDEIQPPQPLAFEAARARIEEDLRNERARQAARERAAELRERHGDLASIAGALGTEPTTTSSFSRAQQVEPFDTATRDLAFSLPVGEISEPREVEEGILLFSVSERQEFDPAEFEQRRQSLERSMLQQRRERLFGAVVARLEAASEVQINQARMDRIEGRT